MSDKANKTACVTFYSYKGGSGRSTTLANTTLHLIGELEASPKNPILIVDADLESAGLTFFFGCENDFSGRFSKSLHTERLFNNPSEYFKGPPRDVIFSKGNEPNYKIPANLLEKIDKIVKRKVPLSGLLSKIDLPHYDIKNFEEIIDAHYSITFEKSELACYPASPERNIEKNFSLHNLANQLSNVSDLQEVKDILLKFLPKRSFVDISNYFGTEIGTVLFLGADIGSEERIAKGKADLAINWLIRECDKEGFRAVLFDSGAGTQSSAHSLHTVSDVILYCMRPSRQFAEGTYSQLSNYRYILEEVLNRKDKKSDKKPVIPLPTAVPALTEPDNYLSVFHRTSFDYIQKLVISFSKLIDPYFCSPDTCLGEVPLFKWREHILGAPYIKSTGDNRPTDIKNALEEYSKTDDFVKYFNSYKKIAEVINKNI